MRGWERQLRWVTAQAQTAIVAVAGPRPAAGGDDDDWIGLEVAVALDLSPLAADHRMHVARTLARCLPLASAALQAGALSWRHVLRLIDDCTGLDDATISAVEARVIGRAATQTVAQFGRSVRRAIIAAAPMAAELKHQVARNDRGVQLRPEPDGMASLIALLPAAEARAAYSVIDAAAHAAKGATDTTGRLLGVDQRRADALTAMLLDPAPAEAAPGAGADVAADAADAAADRPARAGQTGPAQAPGNGPGRARRIPVELQVVIDLPTLLGLTDNPAELAGYGPIPAGAARMLSTDATWRRLVVDPVTGYLLDYGRTRYRPPQALADYTRARDRTCRFPGCGQPAIRCDIDHDKPWSAGGPTSARNTCRRHHGGKTHADWTLHLHPDGSCTWTSPTGHTYHQPPPRQLDP
jgi:hypothetical protein